MSRFACVVVVFALVIFTFLPWTSAAQNKDDKGERERIATVDGVDLNAKFYPCRDAKSKNPPVVLMLHPLGESSAKKNWQALAEVLSEKAAVLTFDFRGHGQSTDILPEQFWKIPFNKNVSHIKNANKSALENKNTIEFKEFEKQYYTALINDIAACKLYLDHKHNQGACNSSRLILLGAEEGATLGTIWLNSEWHRHRLIQNPINLAMAPDVKAEGPDVIGCVWLSARSQLGTRTVSIGSTLSIPLKDKAVPMVFLYGEEDEKAKSVANNAIKFKTTKSKNNYPYTDAVPVKGTKLAGMELLQKSTKVDMSIHGYLFGNEKVDGIVDAKRPPWAEREIRKVQYVWRNPGTPPGAPGTIANPLNDSKLYFDSYMKYIK